jgi:hypothetical protein
MDIYQHADAMLRQAGYRTRVESRGPILLFEDDSLLGFLRTFDNAGELILSWPETEKNVLTRYTAQLRSAPAKAWNVYSIFLASAPAAPEDGYFLGRIEEDFTSTRKIARAGVATAADLQRALLPLLPLQASASFALSDYESTLRSRLSFLAPSVIEGLLTGHSAEEVVRAALNEF